MTRERWADFGERLKEQPIYPVPKPEKRPRTVSKPPARTPVKRVNAKRRKSEFVRCYHSEARVRFVRLMPCAWCGIKQMSVNAHVINGGRGRKAGYEFIVPLCDDDCDGAIGCHSKYDRHLAPFDNEESRAQVRACCDEVQRRWLIVSGGER